MSYFLAIDVVIYSKIEFLGEKMNIDYALIGKRIKFERNKCGLTQEMMAEKLEVTVGYVSQVERGITKISLDLLAKVSTILNCDISSFISGSSVNSSVYMVNEIVSEIYKLKGRDRKIVLSIIKMMNEDN